MLECHVLELAVDSSKHLSDNIEFLLEHPEATQDMKLRFIQKEIEAYKDHIDKAYKLINSEAFVWIQR